MKEDLIHELYFYTLQHTDENFIHQYAVDTYTAQIADHTTKPIAIIFALIGLYLHIERGFTGKQVQQAHMHLAELPKLYPIIHLPVKRGAIQVQDVLLATPGKDRDQMIINWSFSVWDAYRDSHGIIAQLVTSL